MANPTRPTADVVDDVLTEISAAAGEIRTGLARRRDTADAENPSGDRQLTADIWADELLVDRIGAIDGVGSVASEERADVVEVGSGLAVVLDPLDGSSNLESNNLVGTIVGMYDAELPARGRDLVGAAYILYGPTTTLLWATEESGVTEAILDDGGLRTVRSEVTIPSEPVVYGFGGRVPDWPDEIRRFVEEIASELKLRYGGAFVGDVNQVINYGGIFAYPSLRSHPEGKLRLQFEANPIGYIVERAGGASSDGHESLLDVDPTSLHQRTPVYVGSQSLVDRLESAIEAQ